jgi:cation:H+ antiporter
MEMFLKIILYVLSFIVLWYASDLIISSVDKMSKSIKMSRFALSFFILGMLTSMPEIGVGITSIIENDPQIFVGNLLGGVVVIFLFIIPILAIFGNGINLTNRMDPGALFMSLIICVAPSFLVADRRVGIFEAILMILLYLITFYIVQRKQNLVESFESAVKKNGKHNLVSFLRILIGLVLIFFVSDFIVERTMEFSEILKISPFVISVVVLSIGTNLPELFIAVRSLKSNNKDIAFGDYIGSATANTLIFGVMVMINGGAIIIPNHFIQRFIFIFIGLVLFYFFARSKNRLSRKEAVILLLLYLCFIGVELILS